MPSRTLFRHVRLVDPRSGHDGVTNVLIEDESIQDVGRELTGGELAEVGDEVGKGSGVLVEVR